MNAKKLLARWLISAACALVLIGGLWPLACPATAQDVQGDVLFLFDTTGSMYGELGVAQSTAGDILSALAAECNPGFAVAHYRDWPPEDTLPWELVQDVTLDQPSVVNAINSLSAVGGGDWPESVGWALHNSLGIGWREGSVKVVVLVGDAPPHDPDLGADGVLGTADDLPFATVVSELVAAEVRVIGVYARSDPDTIAYWNQVTNATAGRAAIGLDNPAELTTVLKETVCQVITDHVPTQAGGSLRGGVFHDANRNGTWDVGEEGLPGVDFTVYSPGWETTGYTGDDGTYGVVALSESWWGVRVTVPAGWEATTPTDRWGYYISKMGTVYTGINFGLATPEDEEAAPFVLPETGYTAWAGPLLLIAVGLALAGAGLLKRTPHQR